VLKYIRSEERLRTLPVIVMSNAFAGALGREAAVAGATKMFAKNSCGPKRLVKEVRDLLAATAFAPAEISVASDTTIMFADFRKEVTNGMPQRVATLRSLMAELVKERPPKMERLLEIHRAVHQLAGMVSLAGFNTMAQLACALEALVKELHLKPQRVNPSSLRTISEAVETLGAMSARSTQQLEESPSSPLILVVDDEVISRETTCAALEQAHLRALSVGDPLLALRLAADNRFDLLLSDIQMPQMNGFQFCEQFQAIPTNARTPVIFVTGQNEFEAQVRLSAGSGHDFIAKPILLVEVAVKALTHLFRNSARR
jgi:CheY-like chemotaxis protein